MIKNLDSFINSRMKIILIIYEHQIRIEKTCFCPLNQQEISDLVPCSKLKTNQILNDLIKEGYLEMIRRRGRYALTKKSMEIINRLID